MAPKCQTTALMVVSVTLFLLLVVSCNARELHKRSFANLGCMGNYDKSKFARLDRLCEECYQLYREPSVHALCRQNCFKNDYFWKCVDALLLTHEQDKFTQMVDEVYGK